MLSSSFSSTTDIVERLRFFIHLTKDIMRYERDQSEKDTLITMTNTIKLILEELFSSSVIKQHFYTISEKAQKWKSHASSSNEFQLKKRASNTSCFNQRVIPVVHQYYSSKNEESLINDDICCTMFDVIKSSLKHGLSIKNENIHHSNRFVLAKTSSNKFKCLNPQLLLKNKQLKKNLSVSLYKIRQTNYKIIDKRTNSSSQTKLPELSRRAGQRETHLEKVFKDVPNNSFAQGWKTSMIRKKVFTTDKRIKAIGTHYDYNDFFKYYNILIHN